MNRDHIIEVLPDSGMRVWVTLGDNLTRLLDLTWLHKQSGYHSLQFPQLATAPRRTADGLHLYWPDGISLSHESIAQATSVTSPVRLLRIVPAALRFRPLLPLLRAAEPRLHGYLDTRPEAIVRQAIGMRPSEWSAVMNVTALVPATLVAARLSDLYLLLTGLVPRTALPGLLRETWPYAARQTGPSSLPLTGIDCLQRGQFHLLEEPLVQLLLGDHEGQSPEGQMLQSTGATPECPPTTGPQRRGEGAEQRGR